MVRILDHFKQLLLGGSASSEKAIGEQREFLRFLTKDMPEVFLALSDGARFPLANISYGGFSVLVEESAMTTFATDAKTMEGVIHCFHLASPFKFIIVNQYPERLGAQFLHEEIEGLMWLRRILEFFRVGLVMDKFSTDRESPTGIEYYRGLAACNLVVHRDKIDEGIRRVDLSFLDRNVQSKVEVIKTEVVYKRFDDEDDDSFLALEQALFIIAGLVQASSVAGMEPILLRLRNEVNKKFDPQRHAKLSQVS